MAELVTKGIISQATFDKIRDGVDVISAAEQAMYVRVKARGAEWRSRKAAGKIPQRRDVAGVLERLQRAAQGKAPIAGARALP